MSAAVAQIDAKNTKSEPQETHSLMLIGLMGSGKTVIGRMLANALGRDFVDSDKLIEDESGLRITDIFDLYGEEKFREMERRIISKLVDQKNLVISVGGGAFCQSEIRDMAKGKVTVLWLRATPEVLLSRMDNLASRPLLAGDDPLGILQNLHETRFEDYSKADMVIDTDGLSLQQSLDKLLSALQGR
ncbi:MAG: shikimate kinase [Candidatus Puniceispirillaceae bacterium]